MACIYLQPYLKMFALRKMHLREIFANFGKEIRKGLSRQGHESADTKCDITAIPKLPTGKERGIYLSVIFGLQLQIIILELNGNPSEAHVTTQVHDIPESLLVTEDRLYDFIIEKVSLFVRECDKEEVPLAMGVTFVNPIKYTGPPESNIYKWIQAFRGPGPEQKEVLYLLTVSLTRNYDVNIVHIFVSNNTNGVLMYCAYLDQKCRIGVSATRGTNASYLEHKENIEYLTAEQKRRSTTHLVVNTEWAKFGDNGALDCIRSDIDYELDSESSQPGFHIFEKMVSGSNRCELFRLLVRRLIRDKILFNLNPDKFKYLEILDKHGVINLHQLEEIEIDECPEFPLTKNYLLEAFGLKDASIFECYMLKYICEFISKRAAQLYATMLSVLINQIDEPEVVVGADQTLFSLHERYFDTMQDVMLNFVHPGVEFKLLNAQNLAAYGIAIGAGLCINKEIF